MTNHTLMCKYLNIADSYFNGKDVKTKIINKDPTIKGYCRDNSCKTNEAGINAVAAYIFNQFKMSIYDEEYNKYDEYFLMWLSDKLFKIRDKSKDKKTQKGYVDPITLNSAYEKYLKNHKGTFDYWVLFDHIKGLKEANLRYMAEFYLLLNRICKTIVYYETNDTESMELSNYFKKCLIQYRTLYMNISECNSYLHLLKKLKGIYDEFRDSAIKKIDSENKLATYLEKLTTQDGVEINGAKGFISYKFPKKKCNSLDKKSASVQLQSSSKEESPLPQEPEKKESAPQSSELQQTPTPTPLPAPPQAQKQDSPSKPPSPEQSKDQPNEQKDSDGLGNDGDGTDSAPVGKENQSTPGEPFNTGPLIFSISLKGMEKLNDGITWFEMIKNKFICATKHIHNLYNTTLPSIQNAFNKSINFSNHNINNISTDSKQVKPHADSDDNQSESGGAGDDTSPPKKDSEQTQEPRESHDSSENHNSDKNDQESEKPVEVPVVKSENPGTETKGNGTIGIGDIFIFKEFKKIGIPIIVIIISITLAIMYKFLVFERRKKLKRKKMKKVTNLFGVNKTT
ncbi:PIR protein CIR protein [Plasmodium vinckei vinckei]|uniref:PIR protein CIR protein n=1 Tax=Plasmodium vinckei vinckei TaxID=54757 RepID=A0A449BTD2_PLAVN|nr:PIR protein CIR protein [Plasmodium vinckei vinckei]VEV56668.1 PIR protein CIR protein [Plasmodium vinckei vinckei]